MSFRQISRLACDTCGALHGEYPGFATTKQARQAAKKDGWKRVKHFRLRVSILGTKINYRAVYYQDHCPACLLTPEGQTEQRDNDEWQRKTPIDHAAAMHL